MIAPTSKLTTKWRITFENGFIIECYRDRKPTRLANSWSHDQLDDGSTYGTYSIESLGLFNKQILNLHPRTELK